ncbi:MAG: DJ-1 family glyoxalase III [Lentisphaeria bacterium]
MKRAIVIMADGFEEIEAVTVVDIFRRAGVEVVLAGLGALEIKGAHNLEIKAEVLLRTQNAENFDVVVLPGGMPGANHLAQSPVVQEFLKKAAAHHKIIGAICAAPIALHAAGLLEKRHYTCYPNFEHTIGKTYYVGKPVVVDGNFVTSQGPGTSMSFAFRMLRMLHLDEIALNLEDGMLVK